MSSTIDQNLHWKLGWLMPSFGSNLAVRLKNYFFWNKTFLLFKIESWNFQVQFEIELISCFFDIFTALPMILSRIWFTTNSHSLIYVSDIKVLFSKFSDGAGSDIHVLNCHCWSLLNLEHFSNYNLVFFLTSWVHCQWYHQLLD